MRLYFGLFLVLSLLASCGSKPEDAGPTNIRETLVAAIKARREAKKTEGQPKPAPVELTRAAVAHITKPLLYIDVQKLGFKNLFALVAENGPYRTYLNNAKLSVTLNDGLITATRGFGIDLLSQGISIPTEDLFVLTNSPKFYTRTQQQLAKVKQAVEISYACTLERGEVETVTIVEQDYELVKFSEICRNPERAFQNVYWVEDETKQIWKSSQSIGQQAGFFVTEVLIP
ncbi:YjbF family lipoprotein [Amylibacter sp. SFDW26]|uniref:YjbF family lipoprotein n=1 Tax=Amylibacter sp. SFDW26 TaxID=2652722 RepID=UPI0012629A55|nr:YjbF family lipoprotein [Amylibacter sp. SFDW26]KAB7610095.1 YjbF family lipoprotein [Amylibacter sp. SFDW26]